MNKYPGIRKLLAATTTIEACNSKFQMIILDIWLLDT
jgi:hypothetical protein